MSRKRAYTDDQLKLSVETSTSIRQVLLSLGLVPAGGNYETVLSSIERLHISTSHFTGQGWKKGNSNPVTPKRPITDVLVIGRLENSHKLKLRLFEEGIKQCKCESCGLTEWMNKPVPLELDHMNGNRKDNRIKNLRILCPNCHAQTDTYRSRNRLRRCRDLTAPS